jgi:hypothetical protein
MAHLERLMILLSTHAFLRRFGAKGNHRAWAGFQHGADGSREMIPFW